MWKCLKCNRQVEPADENCPTCGGILEELPDRQSLAESGQVVMASVPAPSESGSTAHVPSPEEGEDSEQELARPDWNCPACGEAVPGNFDRCWKCLATEAGEAEPNAAQLLSEVGPIEDVDASPPQFILVPTHPPRGILWLLAAHVVVGLIGTRAVNLGMPSAPLVNCLIPYVFERRIVATYRSVVGGVVSAKVKTLYRRRFGTDHCALALTYRWTVDHTEYEGSRCGYEGYYGLWGRQAAKRAGAELSGRPITVYYDPDRPANAYVLQPHSLSELVSPGLLCLMGLPGTLLGAILLR